MTHPGILSPQRCGLEGGEERTVAVEEA